MADLLEPIADQEAEIEQAMSQLVVEVAQAVLGREPVLPLAQILPVVRAAVRELPVGSRNITVVLHPDQPALLRDCAEWPAAWALPADAAGDEGGRRAVLAPSVL